MRILFGYHYYPYPVDVRDTTELLMARYRDAGFDVRAFPLTVNPPGPKINWPYLDTCWKRGDRQLMAFYEELADALDGCDVLYNYGGQNLHPEFLRQLNVFKVMQHFDDPENSETVSKPVAHAYDLCLVNNRAEVDRYFEWGAKRAEFMPLGYRMEDADPALTEETVRTLPRDVDLTMLCARELPWRRERLDRIASAFPQGRYHGLNWPQGFLAESERIPLYKRTRIGINVHNSTGPINVRLYALPANGVMQICDCKEHLGDVFEVGKEIVAYETTEEAIDLCRYYLDHEDERREIAVAGFMRVVKSYNEVAVFRLAVDRIQSILQEQTLPVKAIGLEIRRGIEEKRNQTRLISSWHGFCRGAGSVVLSLRRWMAGVRRRFTRGRERL